MAGIASDANVLYVQPKFELLFYSVLFSFVDLMLFCLLCNPYFSHRQVT